MKAIKYILYTAFFLLVLGALLLFASPKLPYVGALSIKIVQSGSMEPAINTGGIVVIRSVERYGVGDVVTFTSKDSQIPTTHRIIGTDTVNGIEQFVTKGDANEDPDSTLVSPSSIIGKVVFDVPYIGFIFDFARTPKGFMLLVIPPALLILFDEIEKIVREVRRVRKQKKDDDAEPSSGGGGDSVAQQNLLLYEREASPRFMDIKPLRIPPMASPGALSQSTEEATAVFKVASVAVAALLSVAVFGLSSIGSTVSYFNDTESLLGNLLRAIALDVSASQDASTLSFDENGALIDEDGVVLLLLEKEEGSAEVHYDVRVEKMSGVDALCSALEVAVADPFIYSGSLLALSVSDVDLSSAVALEVMLDSGAYAPLDTCGVDVVFVARVSGENSGYSDEERIPLLFTAPELSFGARFSEILEETLLGGDVEDPIPEEVETEDVPEDVVPPTESDTENVEEENAEPNEPEGVVENEEIETLPPGLEEKENSPEEQTVLIRTITKDEMERTKREKRYGQYEEPDERSETSFSDPVDTEESQEATVEPTLEPGI